MCLCPPYTDGDFFPSGFGIQYPLRWHVLKHLFVLFEVRPCEYSDASHRLIVLPHVLSSMSVMFQQAGPFARDTACCQLPSCKKHSRCSLTKVVVKGLSLRISDLFCSRLLTQIQKINAPLLLHRFCILIDVRGSKRFLISKLSKHWSIVFHAFSTKCATTTAGQASLQ